ncbi:ExbD/TolR family protein [Thiohalorhabdus sp.]|uniref:ExbD/TolR family protein n=1 Tax=Thiohalorhabdus sp. TaxID=3094134 RepID=UPI002FC2873F
MHFPERRPDHTEERILPLINVVFLLLIFFMIAGSLSVTEPFEVEPPASQSQDRHEPDSLTLLMGTDGRFAVANETLTRAQTLQRIETRIEEQPQTRVTLKADGRLPANRLVRFTRALYETGVEKLRLLTRPADS